MQSQQKKWKWNSIKCHGLFFSSCPWRNQWKFIQNNSWNESWRGGKHFFSLSEKKIRVIEYFLSSSFLSSWSIRRIYRENIVNIVMWSVATTMGREWRRIFIIVWGNFLSRVTMSSKIIFFVVKLTFGLFLRWTRWSKKM